MRKKRCASCRAEEGKAHKSFCNYARSPERYPDGAVYINVGAYDSGSSYGGSSCDTSSSSSDSGSSCGGGA